MENVPIAIIVDQSHPNNEGIIYDIRDALDNDENTHCKTFIVYGNVLSAQEAVGPNFQYPETSEPIDVYPIEWLLDPAQAQEVGGYGWLDADLNDRFTRVASIGGQKDKIDYQDFSLIVVGTGAIQKDGLLGKLQTYRDSLSNFVSLGKFTLNGIEYARSIVVFPQIKGYGSYDPLLYYFNGTKRPDGDPYKYNDRVELKIFHASFNFDLCHLLYNFSFGAFKENPTKDNFDKLRARINELKIRLGVDGTVLIQLAEKYLRSRDIAKLVRIKQDMNMAYKQLIKDLILKAVSEDTSEGQAQ